MFYIQTHVNSGYIYLLLPGKTEWSSWSIEYAIDAHFEVKKSGAKKIAVSELPKEITETFDFQNMKPNIMALYKIG